MYRKLNTQKFIAEAIDIHGDKYSYDLVDYQHCLTPVKINCPQHGLFDQRPFIHLRGHGCPKCAGRGLATKERLLRFVSKDGDIHFGEKGACWRWHGSTDRDGYATVSNGKGRFIRAHILSWEIYNGVIPSPSRPFKRMYVSQECKNRECTNPDHLALGLRKKLPVVDEHLSNAKLDREKVERIRALCFSGEYLQSELAQKFDVSGSTISRVINFKTWGNR